jgi:hypothetical protein
MIKPQSAQPAGSNNLLDVDPNVVNPSLISGDFHLKTGSQAIDAADPAASGCAR